jgi:hypothetical protein
MLMITRETTAEEALNYTRWRESFDSGYQLVSVFKLTLTLLLLSEPQNIATLVLEIEITQVQWKGIFHQDQSIWKYFWIPYLLWAELLTP